MDSNSARKAGALLFVGAGQFSIALFVAEAVYPGYSVSGNFISDLGVGPAAAIFNTSVFLVGLLFVIGAYFLNRASGQKIVAALIIVAGVGAMGVGTFPETVRPFHGIAALVAFVFSGLSAIVTYRLQRPPLAYFSVILGVIALIALVLFSTGTYLGLGVGGMERVIVYPVLVWGVGFGGYLMAPSKA